VRPAPAILARIAIGQRDGTPTAHRQAVLDVAGLPAGFKTFMEHHTQAARCRSFSAQFNVAAQDGPPKATDARQHVPEPTAPGKVPEPQTHSPEHPAKRLQQNPLWLNPRPSGRLFFWVDKLSKFSILEK